MGYLSTRIIHSSVSLLTGGLRNRGKFMCGKNVSTSAVLSGVNEVPTYVHIHRSSQPVAQYTHTTGSKITLPNTDLAHDKCQ